MLFRLEIELGAKEEVLKTIDSLIRERATFAQASARQVTALPEGASTWDVKASVEQQKTALRAYARFSNVFRFHERLKSDVFDLKKVLKLREVCRNN